MKIIRLTDNRGETFFSNYNAVLNYLNGKLIYNGNEVKTAEDLGEILESASCAFDFVIKEELTPAHALMGIKPEDIKIIISLIDVHE